MRLTPNFASRATQLLEQQQQANEQALAQQQRNLQAQAEQRAEEQQREIVARRQQVAEAQQAAQQRLHQSIAATTASPISHMKGPAPHIDSKCAEFGHGVMTGFGENDFAFIYNRCSVPIQVIFCYSATRGCTPDGESDTILPGGRDQVAGPHDDLAAGTYYTEYQVCDVSDPARLCVLSGHGVR